MKKARIPAYFSMIIAGTVFSACAIPEGFPGELIKVNKGNQEETTADEKTAPVSSQSFENLSLDEQEMLMLEYKDGTEGLSEEEYSHLADLYEKLGFVKCERDILEKSYRQFQNEEVLEKLQDISVDIEEESSEIQALFGLLSGEDEILSAICGEKWTPTMMPKLHDGKRTYFSVKDGKIDTVIEVGTLETTVYKVVNGNDGKTQGLVIKRSDRETVIYKELGPEISDVYEIGSGNGEKTFEKKTVDTYNGVLRIEEGTLKNGKLDGDFKVTTASFDAYGEVDVKSVLESFGSYDKEEYFGHFEDGKTLEDELPDNAKKALLTGSGSENAVAYAYNKDKSKCLFTGISNAEKDAGYVFEGAFLKLSAAKKMTAYEIKDRSMLTVEMVEAPKNSEEEALKDAGPVRVYDGEIQYFNGKQWVSVGKVSELEDKDPFKEYNEEKPAISTEVAPKTVVNNDVGEIAVSTPTKETNTSSSQTTKKQTSASSTQAKKTTPVATQVTPQVVAPEPATPAAPAEQPSSGGSSSGGSSDPAPEPHSDPTPTPPPADPPSDPTPDSPAEPPASTGDEPEIDAGDLDDDDWTPPDK